MNSKVWKNKGLLIGLDSFQTIYVLLPQKLQSYNFFDNFQVCKEDDENGENDDFFSRPDDDDRAMFGSRLHPRRLRKTLGLGAV